MLQNFGSLSLADHVMQMLGSSKKADGSISDAGACYDQIRRQAQCKKGYRKGAPGGKCVAQNQTKDWKADVKAQCAKDPSNTAFVMSSAR